MFTTEEKFEIMKKMNDFAVNKVQDESNWLRWIMIVPDQATDEDLMDIAEDDELFWDSMRCMGNIVRDELGLA